jgi:hypothetical protein
MLKILILWSEVIMRHTALSDIEYGMRKLRTKRDEFLRIMDNSIPWDK